jgi:hypothetical protein
VSLDHYCLPYSSLFVEEQAHDTIFLS